MARREIVDADGKPIMFGDILYGEDGRAWTVLGPYTKRWLFVSGVNLDGEPVKQPVMAKWMTRVPRKALPSGFLHAFYSICHKQKESD